MIALFVALFRVIISFLIAWHRAVLVGETDGGFAILRFGERGWRFLGYYLLMMLIVGGAYLAVVVFMMLFGALARMLFGAAGAYVIVPVALAAGVILFVALVRLTLVFPAIAVDDGPPCSNAHGRAARATWRGCSSAISVACCRFFVAIALLAACGAYLGRSEPLLRFFCR